MVCFIKPFQRNHLVVLPLTSLTHSLSLKMHLCLEAVCHLPTSTFILNWRWLFPLVNIWQCLVTSWGFPGGSAVKNPPASSGDSRFDPWVRKLSKRRKWQPTPVLLPGESPWTQEPGGRPSMWSQSVGRNFKTEHTHTYAQRHFCWRSRISTGF